MEYFFTVVVTVMILSPLFFFMGYVSGEDKVQKDAVKRNLGSYELNDKNEVVFTWKGK